MGNLLLFSILLLILARSYKFYIYKVAFDGWYISYEIVKWHLAEQRYYTEIIKFKIINLKSKDDGWYNPY